MQRLNTVALPLRSIIIEAMSFQIMDFSVLCGIRTLDEQKELVSKGLSRTLNSRHLPNKNGLSEAVDIAPYPIDWNNHQSFHRLAGIVQAAASLHDTRLRWGGDWDGDNDTNDQSFIDLPHFELRK